MRRPAPSAGLLGAITGRNAWPTNRLTSSGARAPRRRQATASRWRSPATRFWCGTRLILTVPASHSLGPSGQHSLRVSGRVRSTCPTSKSLHRRLARSLRTWLGRGARTSPDPDPPAPTAERTATLAAKGYTIGHRRLGSRRCDVFPGPHLLTPRSAVISVAAVISRHIRNFWRGRLWPALTPRPSPHRGHITADLAYNVGTFLLLYSDSEVPTTHPRGTARCPRCGQPGGGRAGAGRPGRSGPAGPRRRGLGAGLGTAGGPGAAGRDRRSGRAGGRGRSGPRRQAGRDSARVLMDGRRIMV